LASCTNIFLPRRRKSIFRKGIVAALKGDTLSLTSFKVGLFGWMALMQLVFFSVEHLHPDEGAYWALMQIGMILGFITSHPVNWWLIRRKIKEPMSNS
jgi:ABC-type antimicrobial peptide transport system permease subunit